jgi:dihydrofolate reductase
MTISLDGFVADQSGNLERLYPDLGALQGSDYMNAMTAETGAVLMGKRTFEMADDPDSYADTYEFQAPIFVLTHHPPAVPPKQNEHLTFTFVMVAGRRPQRGCHPGRAGDDAADARMLVAATAA